MPGFAVTIRTDENSLTENRIDFYRNGEYFGSSVVEEGTFTNDSKHYVNLQYIKPGNEWSFDFVDLGESGDFPIVTQDNCDWSVIERKTFSYSEGVDKVHGTLGHAKGTATFSGPGVVNHGNGYGRFYAQLAGPGTHTITYTWDDGRGFVGSASQTITVSGDLAVIDAGEDQTVCKGASATLGGNPTAAGGTPGYTFQWYPEDGLDDSFAANPVATPSVTTTYVGMTADMNGEGCVVSDTVTIFVDELNHDGIAHNDTTICLGDSLVLSVSTTHSLLFNGYNDHVYVEDNDKLDLSTAGSIEAWIYPNNNQALGGIVHKGDLADWSDEAYSLQYWNDKRIKFALTGEGVRNKNSLYLRSTSKLDLHQWNHVAVSWNESGIKIYINGELDNSTNEIITPRSSDGGLNIGTLINENFSDKLKKMPFNGNLDEIRIWETAISKEQILHNMYKSLNGDEEGLVAHFNFNEGQGIYANDNSPNAFAGNVLEPEWSTNVPFGESQNTYLWRTGETSNYIVVKPTETTSYGVTVSEGECEFTDEITVNVGGSQTISGEVSYSGGVFNESEITIKAYKLPDYELISEQNIDALSQYNLNLESGNYILRAVLNTLNYPDVFNTYYQSTYAYSLAEIIELNCADDQTADIQMFETESIPAKVSERSISGTIWYVSTAKNAKKEVNRLKSGNKNTQALAGAIVTAETEIEDKPTGYAITDVFKPYSFYTPDYFAQSNDAGYYELKNLNDGLYALQINLPGFETVTTYELAINENNTQFSNMDFIVDGFGEINADNVPTGISEFENNRFLVKTYPVPVKENLTLEYVLENTSDIKIRLLNTSGQVLFNSEKNNQSAGNYSESIKIKESGIYLLQLQVGNQFYMKKIVKE